MDLDPEAGLVVAVLDLADLVVPAVLAVAAVLAAVAQDDHTIETGILVAADHSMRTEQLPRWLQFSRLLQDLCLFWRKINCGTTKDTICEL